MDSFDKSGGPLVLSSRMLPALGIVLGSSQLPATMISGGANSYGGPASASILRWRFEPMGSGQM